jgi:phosphoribosyl-AMP cyclohydrolase
MISLNFNKTADGLLPAIVQDFKTLEILMVAYINNAAWQMTLKTGKAHYWSRSRKTLWLKGETSGHVQIIHNILVDCDDDTVVFQVEQLGAAACHTGHRSCFYRRVAGDVLVAEDDILFDPDIVYGKK